MASTATAASQRVPASVLALGASALTGGIGHRVISSMRAQSGILSSGVGTGGLAVRCMSVSGWGEQRPPKETEGSASLDVKPNEDFTGRKISRWEKSSNFPDFIEAWGRRPFYVTGAAGTAATAGLFAWLGPAASTPWLLGGLMGVYWYQGIRDVGQESHTIKKNYPVLGNIRYIERRSKLKDARILGISSFAEPRDLRSCFLFLSSIFNISAMSYGALSDNAILALNTAAKMGGFSHNTGEGGISKFHLQPGGDIVWNVGTGYFGCRTPDGKFCPDMFRENANRPNVKMIEIKLSQGAKPAHGGMLPGSKVTPEIAEARGIQVGQTCNSPPLHSAFSGPAGLVGFIRTLRGLSGGKPIGMKLCIGKPEEFAAVVHAMLREKVYPDFITVDGGEGGTGAAPPEFSNSVGMPLRDALSFVDNTLTAAGIRDKITVIASGKSLTGFSLVQNMALGADVCNSARAMMFALGCIQALKCNTNRCPTGITTLDKDLMKGLNVENKSTRVYNYHKKTVETALEIMGAAGATAPLEVTRDLIMMRPDGPMSLISYAELYPYEQPGSLTTGLASPKLSHIWLKGEHILKAWDAKSGPVAT